MPSGFAKWRIMLPLFLGILACCWLNSSALCCLGVPLGFGFSHVRMSLASANRPKKTQGVVCALGQGGVFALGDLAYFRPLPFTLSRIVRFLALVESISYGCFLWSIISGSSGIQIPNKTMHARYLLRYNSNPPPPPEKSSPVLFSTLIGRYFTMAICLRFSRNAYFFSLELTAY